MFMRLSVVILASALVLVSSAQAAESAKPNDAQSEELTVTGKSRWQLEDEAHRREFARLHKLFGEPKKEITGRDQFFGGQSMIDPSSWTTRAYGADAVKARLFENMTTETVRGRSRW
jgi:hypothetical protein